MVEYWFVGFVRWGCEVLDACVFWPLGRAAEWDAGVDASVSAGFDFVAGAAWKYASGLAVRYFDGENDRENFAGT